jgi:hypothetical protein
MQILAPYDIWRGAGNGVDSVYSTFLRERVSDNFDVEVATEALLQQAMNHRDAGIFQAYLNERVGCDVQARLSQTSVGRRPYQSCQPHEPLR